MVKTITGIMHNRYFILLCFIILFSINLFNKNIEIQKIKDDVYLHVSYLKTEKWGDVPCNGAFAISGNKAIVFDTPVDSVSSAKLLDYINDTLKCNVEYVVINHFHNDCIGGIAEFNRNGITSVINYRTEALIDTNTIDNYISFDNSLEIKLESLSISNQYLGPAHAPDNIISYISGSNVLFGGCMIKSLGSGKGNLSDADTLEWANTVKSIYPLINDSTIVIPGHGEHGGKNLIDYTIKMFRNDTIKE